jgi:hypothetical protein
VIGGRNLYMELGPEKKIAALIPAYR